MLGRIVVHDRIHVEENVLPRYFNHSSFASLRRQLNYFNFVRVGKGRQRESTYVNDYVVVLDDILHLKRRTSSGYQPSSEAGCSKTSNDDESRPHATNMALVGAKFLSKGRKANADRRRSYKRRREQLTTTATILASGRSSSNHEEKNFVSEDELSDGKQLKLVLDLTKSESKADDEILAGCSALLELATHVWN